MCIDTELHKAVDGGRREYSSYFAASEIKFQTNKDGIKKRKAVNKVVQPEEWRWKQQIFNFKQKMSLLTLKIWWWPESGRIL